MPEWIEFHRQVAGADHVLLFDNGSVDRPERVLAPWTGAGVATVVPWPRPFVQGAQREAYVQALRWAARRTRWIAFIDIDEFLFSPAMTTVAQVLTAFEEHPGVVVNPARLACVSHRTG